jgi:hypothetical protein
VPVAEIAGLVIAGLLGWFWFDSVGARDIAVNAARDACDSEGLQLLDDTVAATGIRLVRDDEGALRLQRIYKFEYSDTGNDRRHGSVILLGHKVLFFNMDVPHRPTGGAALH